MQECMAGTVQPLWISAMLINQQVTLRFEHVCFVHFSGLRPGRIALQRRLQIGKAAIANATMAAPHAYAGNRH